MLQHWGEGQGLINSALYRLLYNPESWSETATDIHDVNRRTMNLLSGIRAWRDQSAHFISNQFGSSSPETRTFDAWTNNEYDSNLGYRVGEALRNHTQHRGLAVHSLTHTMWRDDAGKVAVIRNSLIPLLHPERVAADGDFKASVLQELNNIGEHVDLRPLLRDYLAGVTRIQDKIRGLLQERLQAADELFLGAIERYKREGQQDVGGLVAVEIDDRRRWRDRVPLFSDLVDRRRTLVRRGARLQYVTGFYTTNEPQQPR